MLPMIPSNRIKASSLLLTLVIVLILGILCSAIILLAYYNRQYERADAIGQRLSRNLGSAIDLVLSDSLTDPSPRSDRLDLYGDGNDSIAIKRSLWGVFQAATVTAFNGRFSRQKSFLHGPSLPPYMEGCLYLADHKRPLSLVGRTKLTGDAFLSKSGVKASFINQRGFDYAQLLEGAIKESEEALPPLNSMVVDHLRMIGQAGPGEVRAYAVPAGDSLENLFDNAPLVLQSEGAIYLEQVVLKGQLILRSDSLISVGATARLDQVILVAPVIRLEKGFTGVLQAIATDSIVAEAGTTLGYPSALVLLKEKNNADQPYIRLEDNCLTSGLVITQCSPEDLARTYVSLGSNCRIQGVLYVMGYASLGGPIAGTVLSDYFIYKSGASIYENHLVDVEVNRKQLSKHFTGSAIFAGPQQNRIIEWLP